MPEPRPSELRQTESRLSESPPAREPASREAVALQYRQDAQGAPQVVAKGRGLIAEAIIQRAREAGVYVHESPQLVQLLMQVDLDAHIPPALYVAVAELLAWLWRLEHDAGQS